MFIAIGVGVGLLAAIGSYFMAEIKGREVGIWPFVSFFFPPLILVIAFLPKKGEPEKKQWFAIPLAATASLSVAGWTGFVVWSMLQAGSLSGFPECGSALAHNTAKQAFDNGPPGKLMGLNIIAFRDDKEVSSSETVKQCTTVVTLNTGADRDADYRIELRSDQYFVFIQLR